MTRYLVTGCAGFIGSHLVESLAEQGHAVRGVDCLTDYYPRRLKLANLARVRELADVELLRTDLAEDPLEPLLDDVEGVYHLAAQPGVRTSWGEGFSVYVRDNVIATQRLFEAASARGLRVVFASSSSIYGNALGYPTRESDTPRP